MNSWLGIWGIGVRPDTGYCFASEAKQLNSETVKRWNHNKWYNQLSIGVLRWGTTRLNLQGPRHEVPAFFRYNLHEGTYLRSAEW